MNPQTLVLQSYRRDGVAPWLQRCMSSVRSWAESAGHAYEFVGDELFDPLPDWFRQHCAPQLLPQTDLARLLLMRERLRAGWQRVIWLDADIHVFAPDRMRMDTGTRYALCAEFWLARKDGEALRLSARINNAAMVMARDNPVLEFLIHACLLRVRSTPPGKVNKLALGPHLLSPLGQIVPLHTVREVGMVSPGVLMKLAGGDTRALQLIEKAHGVPMAAANLCGSLVGTPVGDTTMTEQDLWAGMDTLERYARERSSPSKPAP